MKTDDVTCPRCKAGFRRLELLSDLRRTEGEYRCPACDKVLETFDGKKWIAYRLTIPPLSWAFPYIADSNSPANARTAWVLFCSDLRFCPGWQGRFQNSRVKAAASAELHRAACSPQGKRGGTPGSFGQPRFPEPLNEQLRV